MVVQSVSCVASGSSELRGRSKTTVLFFLCVLLFVGKCRVAVLVVMRFSTPFNHRSWCVLERKREVMSETLEGRILLFSSAISAGLERRVDSQTRDHRPQDRIIFVLMMAMKQAGGSIRSEIMVATIIIKVT